MCKKMRGLQVQKNSEDESWRWRACALKPELLPRATATESEGGLEDQWVLMIFTCHSKHNR